jgi:hypothetical protein
MGFLMHAARAFSKDSSVYEFFQRLSSGLNSVASLALSTLALVRTWGGFAEGALNAAFFVIRAGVEGIPGVIESLAGKVFGAVIVGGLNAASLGFFAEYQRLEADATHERSIAASLPDGV